MSGLHQLSRITGVISGSEFVPHQHRIHKGVLLSHNHFLDLHTKIVELLRAMFGKNVIEVNGKKIIDQPEHQLYHPHTSNSSLPVH